MPESIGEPRHLVICIHGIRSYGGWQIKFTHEVEKSNKQVRVFRYRYGFFDLMSLLVPIYRRRAISQLEKQLRAIIEERAPSRVDIFAHSFGTYIIFQALKGISNVYNSDLPIHTIVFAGSVLRQTEDIRGLIEKIGAERFVNECGNSDSVLLLSQFIVLGMGMAGRVGFIALEDDSFQNRYHDLGHDGYFYDRDGKQSFIEEFWLPLISSGSGISQHDDRPMQRKTYSIWRAFVNHFEPIKVAGYLSILLAISLYLYDQNLDSRIARANDIALRSRLHFMEEFGDYAAAASLAVEAYSLARTPDTRGALIEAAYNMPLKIDLAVEATDAVEIYSPYRSKFWRFSAGSLLIPDESGEWLERALPLEVSKIVDISPGGEFLTGETSVGDNIRILRLGNDQEYEIMKEMWSDLPIPKDALFVGSKWLAYVESEKIVVVDLLSATKKERAFGSAIFNLVNAHNSDSFAFSVYSEHYLARHVVMNASSMEVLFEYSAGSDSTRLALSAGGRHLAIADTSKIISIDISSKNKDSVEIPTESWGSDIKYLPNADKLVWGDSDQFGSHVVVWDVLRKRRELNVSSAIDIEIVDALGDFGPLLLWDGKKRSLLSLNGAGVKYGLVNTFNFNDISESESGDFLAASSFYGPLRVWHFDREGGGYQSTEVARGHGGHLTEPKSLVFSRDGSVLFGIGSEAPFVFSLQDESYRAYTVRKGQPRNSAIGDGGRLIVHSFGGLLEDGALLIADLDTEADAVEIQGTADLWGRGKLAIAEYAPVIAFLGDTRGSTDGVSFIDMRSEREGISPQRANISGEVDGLALSPDGAYLGAFSRTGNLHVEKISEGKSETICEINTEHLISSLSILSDSREVAAVSYRGIVSVVDFDQCTLSARFTVPFDVGVAELVFDGNALAIGPWGSLDGNFQRFTDLQKGQSGIHFGELTLISIDETRAVKFICAGLDALGFVQPDGCQ